MNSYAFSSDTSGQSSLPIGGDFRKSEAQLLPYCVSCNYLGFKRSFVYYQFSAGFVGLLADFFTGDTGGHGKDFGKILGDRGVLRVAFVRCHGTNNPNNFGGVYE